MMRHNQPWNTPYFRDALSGYSFMLPTLLVLGVFLVGPILGAIALAFYKVQLLGEVSYHFVGLKNFIRMLEDESVSIALQNTLKYVITVVPIQTILALGLVLLLNTKIQGKNWFKIIFFMPTVTSSAILTLIFMWMYNTNGLLNAVLQFLGWPTYNWLGDPNVALKGIMMMNIWATAPLFMVIYLAALQEVPKSLYEAAEMDGATPWDKFWHITLPFLRPVTFFIVVMGVIGAFQLFDQAYIFSGGSGGPDNATLTLVLLIYQYAFKTLDIGYALALTLLLAIVILSATLIQRTLFKEERLD